MRIALALRALNLANPAPASYIELAQAAERWGYDSVWAPELRGTDPFGLLGWVGGHTNRIGLGCAVAQVTARGPVAMAASALTLDGLSEGRFRLGLGVSGPQVVEGWHGRPFGMSLSYMREYLAVVRMALDGKPISYAGRQVALPLPSASEDVVPMSLPAPPSRLPVYLAGIGRNAVTLAGELADGWIAIHCPPRYMTQARSWLAEGAAKSGHELEGFTTSVMVLCCVDEDEDLARDLVRPALVLFIAAMGTSRVNFYNQLAARLGFEAAAVAMRNAHAAGDMDAAMAAAGDDLVDAMTLCGTPEQVRRKLAAYRDAGVNTLILAPVALSKRSQLEQIEVLGALAECTRVS